MPEIDTRSTKERNFRIEKTSHDTYVVRSDSERFGKNEITYESWNREDCLNYIAQRRPERKIQFYIIPDLMSWSMPDYFDQRTPIERFDSLQEAVARFQELFAQDYNAEMTDRNSFGLTYTRLALGMEWSEQGQHPGAIDLIHVRKGQKDNASHDDVMKDLCGDFTGIDAFNTDRRLLAMLRQLEHEIGFDRVVFYNDGKATTLPYVLWENEFFEEPALVYTLIENDRPMRPLVVDAKALKQEMFASKRHDAQPARRESQQQMRTDLTVVDLHAEALLDTTAGMSAADILNYQMSKFHEALKAHAHQRGHKVVFIHGKGEGVLRQSIVHELKYRYKGYSYQDASFQEYGYGATQVTIR
jgi:hypothetical protein